MTAFIATNAMSGTIENVPNFHQRILANLPTAIDRISVIHARLLGIAKSALNTAE